MAGDGVPIEVLGNDKTVGEWIVAAEWWITELGDALPEASTLFKALVETVKRLQRAEAVVYGLCDAWGDGEHPPPDPHAGGVLHAIWCEAAGYHADHRMLSLASRDSQQTAEEES